MPKLQINTAGEYYTTYPTGKGPRVIHFHDDIKSYLKKNGLRIGDELPLSWRSDTTRWQYTHGMPSKVSTLSGMVNSKCPVCKQPVFYYTNEYGSKVYFDHAGDTWPKHPCMISNSSHIKKGELIRIDTPKIKTNKVSTFFMTKDLSFETLKFITTEKEKNCYFFLHKIDGTFKTLVIITPSFTKELQIKNLIPITQQNNIKQQKPSKPKPTIPSTTPQHKSSFPAESFQKISISAIRFDNDLIYIDIKDNDICKILIKFKKITIDKLSEIILVFKYGIAKSVKIKNGSDIEEYEIEKAYPKNS